MSTVLALPCLLSELYLTGCSEPCAGATQFHHLTAEILKVLSNERATSRTCTGAAYCESDFDVTSAEIERCDQHAQCRSSRTRTLPVLARGIASTCTHVVAAAAGFFLDWPGDLCAPCGEPEHDPSLHRCLFRPLHVMPCRCSACEAVV